MLTCRKPPLRMTSNTCPFHRTDICPTRTGVQCTAWGTYTAWCRWRFLSRFHRSDRTLHIYLSMEGRVVRGTEHCHWGDFFLKNNWKILQFLHLGDNVACTFLSAMEIRRPHVLSKALPLTVLALVSLVLWRTATGWLVAHVDRAVASVQAVVLTNVASALRPGEALGAPAGWCTYNPGQT